MGEQVTIDLGNVSMDIRGGLEPAVKAEIQAKMSFIVPGYKFTPLYKKQLAAARFGSNTKPWDGTKTVAKAPKGYYGGDLLRAPSGLFSYLREVFTAHDIQYVVNDQRNRTLRSQGWGLTGLNMRDYQEPIIQKALQVQRGVMKAATGAGKTPMVVAIMGRAAVFPAIFYVTSKDLLEQAYDQFRRYVTYNGEPAEIGRIGDGHCDIKPITICTIQSAQIALTGKFTPFDDEQPRDKVSLSERQQAEVRDLIHEAQFAYFDEVQHASCETVQAVMEASQKARFRIGGSASPWRDDGLDILIEACFGRWFCDVSASFLIKNNWLIRPEITFNHFKQTLAPAATWQAMYKTYVVENEARNNWIAQRALYHIGENRPTIILIKHIPHAKILSEKIPGCEILCASGDDAKSSKKRKEILNKMRSRELMCIIATSLLDEGVDIPAAGAGIFAGGGKSSTRALQRVGRIIRPDENDPLKTVAYIEEIHDHVKWLDHHAKARRRILATEEEFVIKDNRVDTGLLT